MMDTQQFSDVLEKIYQDPIFRDKDIYKELLSYLYQCSKKNYIPTEIDIASKVLGKNKDFDPAEDTIVRVYFYRLRKKLAEYYAGSGKHDKVRVSIPKGRYCISFVTNAKQKKSRPFVFSKIFALGVIIGVLVILNISQWYYHRERITKAQTPTPIIAMDDPIWSSLFTNKLPTDIVVGDHYIFHEYDEKLQRWRRIMDYQITTEAEYEQFLRQHPNRRISKLPLGELPHMIVFNLNDLLPIFYSFGTKPEILMSKDFIIKSLKNRNLIYIGTFTDLRDLEKLTYNLPVKYQTIRPWDGRLYITNAYGDTIDTLSRYVHNQTKFSRDIALFAKLPGFSTENYFIIAGFSYISKLETVRYICNPDSLIALEKRIKVVHKKIPDYFCIVFEISGFERAGYAPKLRYIFDIDPGYTAELPFATAEDAP